MMNCGRWSLLILILVITVSTVFPQDEIALARHHYERGRKLYRAGQTDQAIEELYTALSVREIYFKAQLLLGRSLVEARRYREAAATLKEIEVPNRDTVEVQKLLGKAYYEMNKLGEASQKLNYAIVLSKRPNYELHYTLSLVKLRQGDGRTAISEAKRAVALRPGFAPAQKVLSDAYLMIGNYKHAEKWLALYLLHVRDQAEVAVLKERMMGIKTLARARPESSVQKPLTRPKVIRIPQTVYTDEARRYRVEGMVRVQALFGKDATIQQAFVVRGLGFGLDEEALKVARGIKFRPGEVDGRPISMWSGVNIVFTLREREREPKTDIRIALQRPLVEEYALR
jgi:TonB family protein